MSFKLDILLGVILKNIKNIFEENNLGDNILKIFLKILNYILLVGLNKSFISRRLLLKIYLEESIFIKNTLSENVIK